METGIAEKDGVRCRHCGVADAVRAGTRRTKGGVRQLYRCNACLRRFSNQRPDARRTDGPAILDALAMVCQGYPYEDVVFALRRRHRVAVAKGTVSKWVRDYAPPYLEARSLSHGHGPVVRSYLFTHRGINYNYKLHLPKLATCPHEGLKRYLLGLPEFIDHAIFEKPGDGTVRCSQQVLAESVGLREYPADIAVKLAGVAVPLALTPRQRHPAVEEYMLSCDRNTIAVEVPVYYYDQQLGQVTGHIDILQWNFGKVAILDYKPNADKENPAKVVTQLTLYAVALGYRCKLPLGEMTCAYFDEKRLYRFWPERAVAWMGGRI